MSIQLQNFAGNYIIKRRITFLKMNDSLYNETHTYLTSKILPFNIPSTVSNFRATAKKYKINKNGYLTRDGKIVVKASMQEEVFLAMHNHSGRIACWERIKKR